jgi:hypothetical protein
MYVKRYVNMYVPIGTGYTPVSFKKSTFNGTKINKDIETKKYQSSLCFFEAYRQQFL